MRLLLAMLMVFMVAVMPMKSEAASCLAPYDIGDMSYSETCMDELGWSQEFTHIDFLAKECFVFSMNGQGYYIYPDCEMSVGGIYYPNSDDCEGNGELNRHLYHTCPYLEPPAESLPQ
jgi:hypothetical protein